LRRLRRFWGSQAVSVITVQPLSSRAVFGLFAGSISFRASRRHIDAAGFFARDEAVSIDVEAAEGVRRTDKLARGNKPVVIVVHDLKPTRALANALGGDRGGRWGCRK